jgi:hypothetical protein
MSDSKDLHRRILFPIDHRVGKTVQDQFSSAMFIKRPPDWRLGDQIDGVVNLSGKADRDVSSASAAG